MSRVSRTDYSGDRIANLEKQINSLYTTTARNKMKSSYDSARINYLEKQMKGIQDDIKGIKGDLDGMGRQLSDIENRVKGGQKGLNMDLDGMARMHNALKSRVEALENKK